MFRAGDVVVVQTNRYELKHLNGKLFFFVKYQSSDEPDLYPCYITEKIDDVNPYDNNTLRFREVFASEIVNVNKSNPDFDFNKYLSNSTKATISQEVFRACMKEEFNRVYENRKKAGNRIFDTIMREIATEFKENHKDEINIDIIKEIEKTIIKDTTGHSLGTSFHDYLEILLKNQAEKYIEEHKAEVIDAMQDSIDIVARKIIEEKMCERIAEIVEEHLKDRF